MTKQYRYDYRVLRPKRFNLWVTLGILLLIGLLGFFFQGGPIQEGIPKN